MEARFKDLLEADSLDQVELIMEIQEEFGIEITEEDCERWRRGDLPDDWLNSAPVPRPRPFPTRPTGAEALPPMDEDAQEREPE